MGHEWPERPDDLADAKRWVDLMSTTTIALSVLRESCALTEGSTRRPIRASPDRMLLAPRGNGVRVALSGQPVRCSSGGRRGFDHGDDGTGGPRWLDPKYLVSVTAVGGQRVDQMQWAVDQYAAAQPVPDVVLLDLGTNDSWQGWTTAATDGGLDHMAAQFPNACVIFATITTRSGVAVLDANAAAINTHIRASGHRTLDWDAMIGYFGEGLLAVPDRIHPSEWGKQMLAAAAAQTIAGCSPGGQ